jgi:hypothetical protein
MTPDEKALLLAVARCVAQHEEEAAEKLGDTSNFAKEIRRLIDAVRPK